jgi:hypothetical protein
MNDYDDVDDLTEQQIASQGVACSRVSDGHLFTFTAEILEQFLERAKAVGRVNVLVRHGSPPDEDGPTGVLQ